jgi:hypothetical protein
VCRGARLTSEPASRGRVTVSYSGALFSTNEADVLLGAIARELVETVRRNTSIDWALKEGVKAKLSVMVKRVLRRHGDPPDKQELATPSAGV